MAHKHYNLVDCMIFVFDSNFSTAAGMRLCAHHYGFIKNEPFELKCHKCQNGIRVEKS